MVTWGKRLHGEKDDMGKGLNGGKDYMGSWNTWARGETWQKDYLLIYREKEYMGKAYKGRWLDCTPHTEITPIGKYKTLE